jgi:putative endonuclease
MREHRYWVYIVGSDSGTLYIGVTNDLSNRVRQHKSGEFDGFAAKYGCNRLLYYEEYGEVLKAIAREKELKGWRRSRKIALIETMNIRWADLAEHLDAEMLMPGEAMR